MDLLQEQLPSLNELKDQMCSLADENVQLRDKYEFPFTKPGHLEGNLGQLAVSKTDLSSKLVSSEEEKLKISKELVEVQIQTNKLREKFEEESFGLKNKILSQEGMLTEMEMERDRLRREIQSVTARVHVAERTERDLIEEYMTLKRNYLTLTEAYKREVDQNEEPSSKMPGLAQTRNALFRQKEEQQRRVRGSAEDVHGQAAQLPGNQDAIKEMLEGLRKSYDEQQHRLEEKVAAMGKEQQEDRRAVRSAQQKLAERSAVLLSSQSQLKEAEEENSNLQMQLKELNEVYRARLVRYLQDLSESMDHLEKEKGAMGPTERSKLRGFVDSMLQEARTSYRAREEQLATAARSYKKRLQRLVRSHQALLIAYRVQREQVLSQPESGLEPGPPEALFSLEPSELRGEMDTEIQALRQDKARLEGQLREAQDQSAVFGRHIQSVKFQESGKSGQISEEAWAEIRKQLHEITNTTQEGLERERAQLITRATVAEQQVLELQEYVDKHLGRYKREILRLRRLLGMETGPAHSTGAPKP